MRLKNRQPYIETPWGDSFFTHDPRFFRTFFPLLAIISLRSLAQLTVNLVDNIMLGRYTELSLSGATLVNQLQFILQQVVHGAGAGISVLGSQYWGKRDIPPIKKIVSIGIKIAIAAALVFFVVTSLLPAQVLGLFTDSREVIEEGCRYLHIMRWTYLFFAFSNALMFSLQCVETAFIGTVMSLSTIIINMCLNYCLIFGNFGFPELGIQGAAYATLTSRIIETVIILIYVLFIDKKLKMKLKDIFSFDFTYLNDFVKAALPVMIAGVLWGLAQAMQTAILGHINASVIAANSIAVVIFQIFVVVGMSSASAASVTMGKTVGEGRYDAVRPYSRTMQFTFLCIGLISGTAMFLFRKQIVSFYTVSAETRALAEQFLVVLAITGVGSCYEFPMEGGIIAGGGNPRYQAIVDTLFIWCFSLPVSAIAAFVFEASPVVVFCCLKADQILKCIPNSIVCNRYKWVRKLTRDS